MRAIVKGTYHPNSDGSNRSHIIRKYCKIGLQVEVAPDPGNPHEPEAMAVYLVVRRLLVPKKLQIGYLEATILHVSPEEYAAGAKRHGKVVRIHAPFGDNSPRVTIEIRR